MTYTYAILHVSRSTYDEIRTKLADAGYEWAFHKSDEGEVIDMHGIGLSVEPVIDPRRCKCGHLDIDHRHPSSSRARICLNPKCSCREFVLEDRS